ncbi:MULTISPECIES: DUF5133 domain-containing protein [unclassified Streptomyces]|uniref:DUF5133 domain-containing protein n=1 Tax=unclassified Streptomyces TaxID=2593676 RepID=UPI00368EEDC0
MRIPLPATLSRLGTEYEALTAHEREAVPSAHQRLTDRSFTLCVSTGTREITDALRVARSYRGKKAATMQRRAIPAMPKPPSCLGGWHRDSPRAAAGSTTQSVTSTVSE